MDIVIGSRVHRFRVHTRRLVLLSSNARRKKTILDIREIKLNT